MLSRLPAQLCPLCSHPHPTHNHTPTPAPHLSYLPFLPCSATGIRTSILRSSQPPPVPAPFPTLAEVVAVCNCATTRTRFDVQFYTKESINSPSIQLASALVVVCIYDNPPSLCAPARNAGLHRLHPSNHPRRLSKPALISATQIQATELDNAFARITPASASASSRAAPVLCFCALELLCYPLPATSCPLSVVRSPPLKRQHSATAQLASHSADRNSETSPTALNPSIRHPSIHPRPSIYFPVPRAASRTARVP